MKSLFYMLLVLTISACNFPEHYFSPTPDCNPSLEIEKHKNPLAEETQQLVINILRQKQPEAYRYFFETFLEEGNKTYMITNFREKNNCFDVKMLINKWDKLAGMRKTNGKAYPKELYDLKWEIQLLQNCQEVVYIDMHTIID